MWAKSALVRGIGEVCSLLRRSSPAPGLRILLYHAVGTRLDFDRYGMTVATSALREQMTLLKQNGSVMVVPLDPIALSMSTGTRVAITFDDGYRDHLVTAAPIMAELGIPFTVFIVPGYVEGGSPYYLTVRQLKELAAMPGCTVGSHGMAHVRLAELGEDALVRELRDSRRWLEDRLSRAVNMLAYPHGSANRRVREAAASVGYTLAVCSHHGINTEKRDPLMLCRTEILRGDSLRVFDRKLSGALDWRRFRVRDPVRA